MQGDLLSGVSDDTPANQPENQAHMPLAARMRPQSLEEVAGQQHLLGPGRPLTQAVERGRIHSMILWGPPGTGKTTLANLLANQQAAQFVALSAISSGVKEVRQALDSAKLRQQQHQQSTVLFIDEIHRFSKSQQDALLHGVEEGVVTLIGATTENPSFELNNALLSRMRVYLLKSLDAKALSQLLQRALSDERGLANKYQAKTKIIEQLAQAADGDARRALGLLEVCADLASDGQIDIGILKEALAAQPRQFDKGGDHFYDQISALHKSIRGSQPDAALYWFARMLDGGCDPLYIARRLVRIASEDIGNADPRCLRICLDAWDTYERLGSPEGELAIAQALVYLAVAAKSNAVYQAFNQACDAVKQSGSLPVPVHLRNAPTKLMKSLGHGDEYRYAHDEEQAYAAGENYFPEGLEGTQFYFPVERGLELKIAQKLEQLRRWDKQAQNQQGQIDNNQTDHNNS